MSLLGSDAVELPSTGKPSTGKPSTGKPSTGKLGALIEKARTPEGMKKIRFGAVSAIAIITSSLTLGFCYGILGWDEEHSIAAQVAAFMTSTVASYVLNRRWVWGRHGRSDFMKEVLPFWGIGIAQFFLSVPFIQWARIVIERNFDGKLIRTGLILLASLVVYAIMWVGKYIFFNKVLFADKTEQAA